MKTSATLFLFPLILAACAQTPPAEIPQTPADIAWHLVRLEGQEVPAKAGVEPAYLRLTREKRVEGSGGCNRIAGEYRQTGEQIEFGPLISTRRACFSGMAEENAFLKALERARFWKQEGNLLRFYDAGKGLLLEMEKK